MGYGFREGSGGGRRFGGGEHRGGGGGFRRFPREMHKIKCSECGKDSEVPFKPRGDLPVYCRDCFMKKKGIEPGKPFGENKEESNQVAKDAEQAEAAAAPKNAEKVEDSENF